MAVKIVMLLLILFLNDLGEANSKSYILKTLDESLGPNNNRKGKSHEPENCAKVKVCHNGKIYPTSCDVPSPSFEPPCEDFQELGTTRKFWIKDCICSKDNLCGLETPMTNFTGGLLNCGCAGGLAGNPCHPDQCPSGSSCVHHAADGASQCCPDDNLCGLETPMTNFTGGLLNCGCAGGLAGNPCHPDQCPSGSSCVHHVADGASQCCPDEGAQVCGDKNCGLICKRGQKCVLSGCMCFMAPCCCSVGCAQRKH